VTGEHVELAPAKVNVTLRILGRRADGYHELESIVVFAEFGDGLSFVPGSELRLLVRGPTAAASGSIDDNLVIKAARALADRVPGLEVGTFLLSKRLPVAAGIGGGSSSSSTTNAGLNTSSHSKAAAAISSGLSSAAKKKGTGGGGNSTSSS